MPQPNKIEIITADNEVIFISPFGRSYTESSEFIKREDRSANGKLRRDIIAEKKTFTLSYDSIDNIDLITLENLLTNHADEVLQFNITRVNTIGQDVVKIYRVMIQPFSRQRDNGNLWKGVSVEFTEV